MPTPDSSNRATAPWPLRLFSSIWLGVILLSLLFVYSSIGSAGLWVPNALNPLPESTWVNINESWTQWQVRQAPGLEMTEFEWFHWWPFDLMIALICVNLVVATLRRIPFKPVNYGVWMIHSGIIILCIGSVIYFSTKVEGDSPVLRRNLVIDLPGYDRVTVPAVPGNRAVIGEGPDGYLIEVFGIDPQWELLSGDDKGKRAFKVTVSVQTATQFFVRDIVAGFPQYTQDLIRTDNPQQPMQRAVNAIGKPLVDERLSLTLDYQPQHHIYLANNISKSWALYVREKGETDWAQRPISGLPLYNDHLDDPAAAWPVTGTTDQPRRGLDVAVPPVEENDPLPGTDLEITSYLRHAFLRSRRVPGDTLDPVAGVLLDSGTGVQREYELAALDNERNLEEGGRLGFAWAGSPEQLAAMGEFRPAVVTITVPDTDLEIEHVVRETVRTNPDLEFTPIDGSDYEYRVRFLENNLRITENQMISVAAVEVRNGEDLYTRWVSDDPRFTRDMIDESAATADRHAGQRELDTGIEMTYDRGARPPVPVLLIAGPKPDDLVLQLAISGDPPVRMPVVIGEPLQIDRGITLTVNNYSAMSRTETRPFIVPKAQRDRDAREQFAMVRVQVPTGSGSRAVWVPFHLYAIRDGDHNFRRFRYQPTEVVLDDKRTIELLFSRQRIDLPAPVILEDFQLTTHVGGFSGQVGSIRDWTSMVRFKTDDGWTEPRPVSVNKPVEHGGFWYFQAQWDPPSGPRFEGDRPYPGLNYTVLGVGNRHGVVIQLIGCVIAVIGMIYAFYIKPIIKRRQQQAVYEQVAAAKTDPDADNGALIASRTEGEA